MSRRYSPDCSWVVAVDPGKTYGVALYERKGRGWVLQSCRVGTGLPTDLAYYRDYPLHLLCEGTSFGGASRYIQRCIGQFEGVLNTTAATVPVGVWRAAAYTPKQIADTRGKRGGWKRLAVKRCEKLGLQIPEGEEAHHAAEAALIGYAYTKGLLPVEKIKAGT